jgi:hypothetical protein
MNRRRLRSVFVSWAFLLLSVALGGAGRPARADSYAVLPAVISRAGGSLCGSPAHDIVFTIGESRMVTKWGRGAKGVWGVRRWRGHRVTVLATNPDQGGNRT